MRPPTRAAGLALGLAALAACGGDGAGADASADVSAREDALAVDVLDALDAGDVTAATDADVDADATEGPDTGDAIASDGVTLSAAVALPGKRVAVRVDATEPRSGLVAIGATEVLLHHGRGVVTTTPEAAPDLHLATRAWDAATDLRIDGERVVAAGETLTIAAGTRVLMGKDARLVVDGALVVAGTAAAPVLFTPDGEPWAAIDVRAGGTAELREAWLVGGGADHDRFGGHSGSDPVVAVIGGALTMRGGGIVDGVGKALYDEGATLDLDGVTIARCDTGGEHVESTVALRHAWVFEIPDADGAFDDDDNDGVYCRLGTATIEDTVFALGEDDAIDHNGADLTVRRVLIDGFRHEGIATSTGGVVTIEDVTIRDADQGIECGYGAPAVTVTRATITGCRNGLRWGDEYEWEALGTLSVERAVVLGNAVGVESTDPQQGPAPAGAVVIACSAVATPAWSAVAGNIDDAPPFAAGCPPPLSACEGPIGATGALAACEP